MEQNLLKVENKKTNKIKDIFNYINRGEGIQKIFLALVIPLGLMFLIFLMPYYAPDEYAHIIKSYDVSQGNFVTQHPTGDGKYRVIVPKDFTHYNFANFKKYEHLKEALTKPTDYNDTTELYTEAQANFGIIYLPSAIGFVIARLFNMNMMVAIYLARLFNFIFFIILGYYAIKIIPFGKMILLIYMLTPMYLQQSTSLSPDCMINVMIIFFVANTLRIALGEKDFGKKDIAFFVIESIFIAMAKYVYLPILGLMLILIKNKNIDKKKLIIFITICYIIGISVGLGCMKFSSRYIDERDYVQNNNINASEQISYIIDNPKEFLTLFNKTLETQSVDWLYDFAGWRLGWQSIEIPQTITLLTLFLILTSPFVENHKEVLNKKEKIFSILIFLGIGMLIILGFYITWTVVGANYITGVQGRYFLPIAIIFLLSCCLKNNYIKGVGIFYYIAIIFINISAITNITNYFMK